MDEVSRIKEAYRKRDASDKRRLYTLFNAASLFTYHQREKAIIDVLKENALTDLSDKRILDVGCGNGSVLRDFLKYGAVPENCYGIDLLPDRIKTAKRLSPHMNFLCGNAEKLPYEDDFFDIVLCFTIFTSIFDTKMKHNIASEMLRVLNANGIILWYDYHINNPKNPDVRGVKKNEIYELFPNCIIELKRITLVQPLARLVAPWSLLLCYILEKIPLLKTHYLGVIKKS